MRALKVVQIAGPSEADTVRDALCRAADGSVPGWWVVREYVDAMGDLIAASDLVVCRSGATTLAELAVLGKAMVLVPYPYATDDHQTGNARPFVDGGAAVVVADADLDSGAFETAVTGLLADPVRRAEMGAAARLLGRSHAAHAVADAVRAAGADRTRARTRDNGRGDS